MRVGTPGFLLGMLRPWLGQLLISGSRSGNAAEERDVCSVLVWEGRTPEGGEERRKKMSGHAPGLLHAVRWLPLKGGERRSALGDAFREVSVVLLRE